MKIIDDIKYILSIEDENELYTRSLQILQYISESIYSSIKEDFIFKEFINIVTNNFKKNPQIKEQLDRIEEINKKYKNKRKRVSWKSEIKSIKHYQIEQQEEIKSKLNSPIKKYNAVPKEYGKEAQIQEEREKQTVKVTNIINKQIFIPMELAEEPSKYNNVNYFSVDTVSLPCIDLSKENTTYAYDDNFNTDVNLLSKIKVKELKAKIKEMKMTRKIEEWT
ncbi:hypothetical protein SLOPH_485 [Spraguea lophii 42_110]|uniref:Uncharacterized protein n=1 Tax=Spraguea lophii (strain 42_110) TaxID=1358809 RepID=S7W674_SPRLO|nr:hypothetical protein SLOPH_485 [Spraguea lophii 42_110]